LIKEFDLRAMFRRYRIVFCDVPASVPVTFWRAFWQAFWQLIDFLYGLAFLGGNPGRGVGEFDGGYVNAGRACG
jgi:hypothetical protein